MSSLKYILCTPSIFLVDTPIDTPMITTRQRGGRGTETSHGDGRAGDVLTKDFLRKFIHYAKHRVHPVLSEAAMEQISSAYANMRAKQSQKNLPVTARSLETIIRLSSAAAKVDCFLSIDRSLTSLNNHTLDSPHFFLLTLTLLYLL